MELFLFKMVNNVEFKSAIAYDLCSSFVCGIFSFNFCILGFPFLWYYNLRILFSPFSTRHPSLVWLLVLSGTTLCQHAFLQPNVCILCTYVESNCHPLCPHSASTTHQRPVCVCGRCAISSHTPVQGPFPMYWLDIFWIIVQHGDCINE